MVAIFILIGGIVILIVENLYEKKNYKNKDYRITYFKAFIIGLGQCFSIIPGVSRSATTIVSCMLQNIERKKAIEFSFFLSFPVIFIATCKKLFDHYFQFQYFTFSFNVRRFFIFPIIDKNFFLQEDIKLLLVGNIVSFITGILSIKCFMSYLKKNNFKIFGYYRIIFGILFIIIHYFIKPIENF